MPKVSIIVPVWNTEKQLEKCLESIVNQSLKDIEIIIINDGSPDNSQKIIDKYSKKYNNIIAIKQKNQGLGAARNAGLKIANGEYIGFVDSDDWIELNMYEELYNYAKENDLDIAECRVNYIFNSLSIPFPQKKYGIIDMKENPEIYLYTENCAWDKIYKKELFNNKQFPARIWYEDLALIKGILLEANKVGQLKKKLYNYQYNSGSIMSKSKEFNPRVVELLDSLDLYNKSVPENLKEKMNSEIVGVNILNMLGIIMFIPYQIKFDEIQKKELINLFFNYLDLELPNWQANKYYKKGFKQNRLINIIAKKCKKYEDITIRTCKTKDEIKEKINELLI